MQYKTKMNNHNRNSHELIKKKSIGDQYPAGYRKHYANHPSFIGGNGKNNDGREKHLRFTEEKYRCN